MDAHPEPYGRRGRSELNAVAVAGPDDVWAVGDSGPARHTLIEHWDGAACWDGAAWTKG